jgi:hypothetical protein
MFCSFDFILNYFSSNMIAFLSIDSWEGEDIVYHCFLFPGGFPEDPSTALDELTFAFVAGDQDCCLTSGYIYSFVKTSDSQQIVNHVVLELVVGPIQIFVRKLAHIFFVILALFLKFGSYFIHLLRVFAEYDSWRWNVLIEKISEDRELAREELVPTGDREPTQAGSFQIFKGRKNVTTKVEEMLQEADEEVFHVGSGPAAERFQYHTPVLEDLDGEDVTVRALFPKTDANEAALDELAETCVVRDREDPGAGSAIMIVDEDQAIVWHPVPDDSHVFQGDDVAMWTDDGVVVEDLKAGFEASWSTGEEVPPCSPPA